MVMQLSFLELCFCIGSDPILMINDILRSETVMFELTIALTIFLIEWLTSIYWFSNLISAVDGNKADEEFFGD